MAVDLHALASAIGAEPAPGSASAAVIDATHDSRQVEPGWLYCCVPGANVDGHDFADQAVAAGAAALLVQRPLDVTAPQLLVDDVRAAMGPAAAEIHGHPARDLMVVGVTGTNGKSSTVQLLADMWERAGIAAEILGTLQGARTTPEGTDLQRMLRGFAERGVRAVAMEVSSHALSLHRVAGTRFAAAMFTNLGRDHLDFHKTVEAYFEAKAALFTDAYTEVGVVNVDDEYGRRLADPALAERHGIRIVPYGLGDADELEFIGPTSRFRWRDLPITLQLAGTHNVLNALAAATCAELLGMEPVDIADALCATSPVRGRFEVVEAGQAFHIAVDYAHTPDALDAALTAARQVAGAGRVIVVFGCGGDRDLEKRAEMGRVAELGADRVIVTSDNPRSEDPDVIIDAVVEGMEAAPTDGRLEIEPDRRAAIHLAVSEADAGDLVLIAGKGHETYQIIGDHTIDFDDRAVALEALGVGA